jgi:hypothetical protein
MGRRKMRMKMERVTKKKRLPDVFVGSKTTQACLPLGGRLSVATGRLLGSRINMR